jgi:hypothetical protein
LELIPASTENIIPGTLVWDPIIGKPDFEHRGMPNHIFNAFLDAELIDRNEWQELLKQARQETTINAQLAETTVDIDKDAVTNLQYPQIGKLEHQFELKKVSKFAFGDIKARAMSNLMRVKIDDFLEEMKKNRWDDYDGRIRRVFMITELYYGNIKLVVNRDLKNDLDAGIKNTDLKVENKLELGKSVEYTFKHQDVPFAMRLERVKHFNG